MSQIVLYFLQSTSVLSLLYRRSLDTFYRGITTKHVQLLNALHLNGLIGSFADGVAELKQT